ncbi:hypothetical protein FBU30_001836 [Linnemannia zychae]|nr:hypothetical protein FBU30_001836 [Linnemannia zychae]
MIPGECLMNGVYMLVMQYDGNLVLYNGNRPCWSSGTDGTDGVYAVFSGDWAIDSPNFKLESPFGELRRYRGGYTYLHKTGANVSLNGKGEVWVGWQRVFWC